MHRLISYNFPRSNMLQIGCKSFRYMYEIRLRNFRSFRGVVGIWVMALFAGRQRKSNKTSLESLEYSI